MDQRLTFLTKKYTHRLQTGLIPAVHRFFGTTFYTKRLRCYKWQLDYQTAQNKILLARIKLRGPGSVVDIATGYGLDSPGIESPAGGEIFRTCPDRPWGPPNLLYNGYRIFSGGKEQPRRDADSSSPSSAVVKEEQNYTSTPPMGPTACTGPQGLYKGALYFIPY